MKFNNEQVELAMVEIGSAVLRLQRAGLSENQVRKVVTKLLESDELPVCCDEKMWDEGEPKGDESAPAVRESDEAPDTVRAHDEAPDTERDPKLAHGSDDEEVPDTVKESDDESPETQRDPIPWHKKVHVDRDDDEEEPNTVRETQVEGWDRFMDQILISEGRKASAREKNLPDSPGMLHAKRYGEKAHNKIVFRK